MNTSDLDSEGSRRLALSAQRGELHHTGDRVYLGSLDDSVSRYPWENLVPSIGHLNRTLIDAALFGAPLCVRVGNLLYQPEYLPALLDSSASPLIDLARVGFIQIQTIRSGINNSIEARIKEGTRSAQEFVAKHDWRPGSVIHDKLCSLDSMLLGSPGVAQYNTDFRRTFRKIMKESVSSGIDEFSRVIEVWLNRPEKGYGYQSRDNFENDAISILGHDAAAVRKAMWVANAANHYAYALHLYNASAGTRPMVETSQFDRHAEVCAIRDKVSAEQAKEILGKQDPVNRALEIIQIPEEVYHPQCWHKLAQLVRPDDDVSGSTDNRDRLLRRNFLHAKHELASKIDFFLDNPEKFQEKEIFEASKEYSERLREALGTNGESRLRLHLHLALQQARISGTSAAMSSGVSTALGLGLDIMTAGFPGLGTAAGFTIGFMLEVLGLNIGDILLRVSQQKITQDGIVDVNDESSAAATDLVKQANNRYGSYVGIRSISPTKAAQLLDSLNKGN
jgi:hypothetical protein